MSRPVRSLPLPALPRRGAALVAAWVAFWPGGPGAAQDRPAMPKTIECYCTDTSGARRALGALICLRVDGRAFIARCEMALNVPIWRDTKEGCVTSRLGPPDASVPPAASPNAPPGPG